uniref:Uncharacterized protein n=1 Tax=Arundo donax TaxID=35708 RepID=A0A0A9B7X7_ARUDO
MRKFERRQGKVKQSHLQSMRCK